LCYAFDDGKQKNVRSAYYSPIGGLPWRKHQLRRAPLCCLVCLFSRRAPLARLVALTHATAEVLRERITCKICKTCLRAYAGAGLVHAWPLGGGWVVYVGASTAPGNVVFASPSLQTDRAVWEALNG
jgi:hypothetical protein